MFHLGTPVLVMLGLSLMSGLIVAVRSPPPQTDVHFWLYSEEHARAYRDILPAFTRRTGKTVGLDLIPQQSLNSRLVSLFMTGRTEGQLPDVVELEIADVGKFLRPPIDEVGLLPLNQYLERSGFLEIPDTWPQVMRARTRAARPTERSTPIGKADGSSTRIDRARMPGSIASSAIGLRSGASKE